MVKRNKSALANKWCLIFLCIAVGAFVAACDLFRFEKVTMLPLAIPGAEYVGMDTCIECHADEHKYFQMSEHASVTIALSAEEQEEGAQAEGCETCHGPGSLHVAGRGDKSKIINAESETCFKCHLDVKGKFALQHHHPVTEGRMTCSSCHDMHGSDVRTTGGAMLAGKDDKCFKCHKEVRGPFVFEHEAMREGCSVCHNPHGSINDKLLVAGHTTTCVRCHWEDEIHHDRYPIAIRRDCIDCHTRVHGSNNARSSLRY